MKQLILITCLLSQTVFAKGGSPNTVADYIVPGPAELVPYSRFKVEIVKPFEGSYTNEISYKFPEELTGSPALVANLKFVSVDKTTDTSVWESPEIKAVCTEDGDRFTCNIYVKKTQIAAAKSFMQSLSFTNLAPMAVVKTQTMIPLIDKMSVIKFLEKSTLDPQLLQIQKDVLDNFLDSEPGGILSYDFQ